MNNSSHKQIAPDSLIEEAAKAIYEAQVEEATCGDLSDGATTACADCTGSAVDE